jgi:hypothetical protein
MKSVDVDKWNTRYDNEIASLKQHKVWTLVPRTSVSADCKIIRKEPCFTTKRNETNKITHHKVRVIAKGYSQINNIDYMDTYAPVTCMESMCTNLHMGATLDYEIHQVDVKTGFLPGDLEDEVYMKQLEGRKEPGKEDCVGRFNKTLYGLKQASCDWTVYLH